MTRENVQTIVLVTAYVIANGIKRVDFANGMHATYYMSNWAMVYDAANNVIEMFEEDGVISDGDYISGFERLVDYLFENDILREEA